MQSLGVNAGSSEQHPSVGPRGLFGRGNNKVLRQRVGGLIKRYPCDIKTPGNAIPTPFQALSVSFMKLLTPYSGTPSLPLVSQVGTLTPATKRSDFLMLTCGGRYKHAFLSLSLSDPWTWRFLRRRVSTDSDTKAVKSVLVRGTYLILSEGAREMTGHLGECVATIKICLLTACGLGRRRNQERACPTSMRI